MQTHELLNYYDHGRKPMNYKVSVVVPNHGRDLTSLKESVLLPHEFIEVNLGLERSVQRNIGIIRATGDILLILDSDQTIQNGLIEECIYLISQGYTALYIPEIIVAKSLFGRIRKFEREFYTGTAIDVPRAIRADACPMFDLKLNGPEDADWGNKIHGRKGITSHSLYHHDDITISEYIHKKAYYTKSMKLYAEKWPNDPCLNIKYRCFTVFVERGKWKKLLRHPLLSIGIIFVLALRGWIYYANR